MDKEVFLRRLSPKELRELGFGDERRLIPYLHRNPLIRRLYWSKTEAVLEYPDSKNVLELGCGGGLALPLLSQNFPEVYGLDLDISMAKKIVERFQLKNVKLFECDIGNMPFKKEQFDLVFASSVFEHIKDLPAYLPAIAQIIRPGGKLVTVTPTENMMYRLGRIFFGHRKPKDHYHTAKEIRTVLLDSGHFKIEKTRYLPLNLNHSLSLHEVLFLSKK